MTNKPYAAMQSLLKDQTAAAQAMKEAAEILKNAASIMNESAAASSTPELSPSYGGGPNGGRPRMSQHQSARPVHTDTMPSRGRGLTGIRNAVADTAHARVGSGSGSSFEHLYDTQGNHIGYRETKSDGTQAIRDNDDPSIKSDIASAGRRSAISKGINAFSEKGLLGGARAVPYVGAAVMGAEAVHEGFAKYGQERQANSQYQSIYGGSNFGTGFSNRIQGEGFKLGQMFSGGLTPGQSDQAFKGVSALGIQGNQRSTDLNFISSSYKSMGMGVAQSLDLINTASKNLNTNLLGLKDSLQSVSDTAKATGQSGVLARQNYSQAYSAISSAMPGSSASTLAGAFSNLQTGLGRSMQGLNFTDPLTTQGGRYQLASIAGVTSSQIVGMTQTNPSVITNAMDQLNNNILGQFETPQFKQIVDQQVQKIAGGLDAIKANPDLAGTGIAPALLTANAVQVDQLIAALGRLGVTGIDSSSPEKAVAYLVLKYLNIPGTYTQNYNKLNNKQRDPSKQKYSTSTVINANGSAVGQTSPIANSKGVNPVVDKALTSLKGVDVTVQSAGGARVVSIEEAAKDYTDQVATGTAIISSGNYNGQAIKDVVGSESNYYSTGGANTSNYVASKGQTDKKSGLDSSRGMDPAAYSAMVTAAAQKSNGGTVTIAPTPVLQTLLNFNASGNVVISTDAAAAGVPPQAGG